MVRQVILIFNVREHRQDYINIYNLTRHICVTENTLSCAYATHSNSTFLVVMLKTQITGTHYVILLMIHFEYFQKIFNVVTNCNVMGHTRTKSKGKSKVQFFSNFVFNCFLPSVSKKIEVPESLEAEDEILVEIDMKRRKIREKFITKLPSSPFKECIDAVVTEEVEVPSSPTRGKKRKRSDCSSSEKPPVKKQLGRSLCTQCNTEFTENDFRRHNRLEHDVACSECEDKFVDNESLVSHRKKVHPSPSASERVCPQCGKTFQTEKTFLSHSKQPHPNHCCYQGCSFTFSKKSDLSDHIKAHESEKYRRGNSIDSLKNIRISPLNTNSLQRKKSTDSNASEVEVPAQRAERRRLSSKVREQKDGDGEEWTPGSIKRRATVCSTEIVPVQRPRRQSCAYRDLNVPVENPKPSESLSAAVEEGTDERRRSMSGRGRRKSGTPGLGADQYWRCDMCADVYGTSDKLEAHRAKPHKLPCEEEGCQSKFVCVSERLKHNFHKHDKKKQLFKCDLCQEMVDSKSRKTHINRSHDVKCPEINCNVRSNEDGIWVHRILVHDYGICMNEPDKSKPEEQLADEVDREELNKEEIQEVQEVQEEPNKEGIQEHQVVQEQLNDQEIQEGQEELNVEEIQENLVVPEELSKEIQELQEVRDELNEEEHELVQEKPNKEEIQEHQAFQEELSNEEIQKLNEEEILEEEKKGVDNEDVIIAPDSLETPLITEGSPEREDMDVPGVSRLSPLSEKSPQSGPAFRECPRCRVLVPRRRLSLHQAKLHSLPCPAAECSLKFTCEKEKLQHCLESHDLTQHVSRAGYQFCPECRELFDSGEGQMYRLHTSEADHLTCYKCHLKFGQHKDKLHKFHVDTHSESSDLKCPHCDLRYLSTDRIRHAQHIIKGHEVGPCPHCPQGKPLTFATPERFLRHHGQCCPPAATEHCDCLRKFCRTVTDPDFVPPEFNITTENAYDLNERMVITLDSSVEELDDYEPKVDSEPKTEMKGNDDDDGGFEMNDSEVGISLEASNCDEQSEKTLAMEKNKNFEEGEVLPADSVSEMISSAPDAKKSSSNENFSRNNSDSLSEVEPLFVEEKRDTKADFGVSENERNLSMFSTQGDVRLEDNVEEREHSVAGRLISVAGQEKFEVNKAFETIVIESGGEDNPTSPDDGYDEIDALLDSDSESEDPLPILSNTNQSADVLPGSETQSRRPLQCPKCLLVHKKESQYRIHISKNHQFKCEFCPLSFTFANGLSEHKNLEHPATLSRRRSSEKTKKNDQSSWKSATKSVKVKKSKVLVKEDKSKLSTDDVLECATCHQCFVKTEDFQVHIEQEHSHHCGIEGCALSFPSQYFHQLHQFEAHSVGTMPSPEQDNGVQDSLEVPFATNNSKRVKKKSSQTTSKLPKREKKEKSVQLKHFCTDCGENFASKKNLSQHIKRKHPWLTNSESNDVICSRCEEKYPDMETFTRHQQEDHRFHCHRCERAFVSRNKLGEHLGSRHDIRLIMIGDNFTAYLTHERSEDNKKAVQWVPEWIESQEAADHLEKVMSGTFPSVRHRLFLNRRQRESCAGPQSSLLYQLSNPGWLERHGEERMDDSVILRLKQVFNLYFEMVSYLVIIKFK